MTRNRLDPHRDSSHRHRVRATAVAVGVGLLGGLLAGCTYKPLVSGELEGLADELTVLRGVDDIRLYISDSPFSDESTVTLTLAADVQRADLEAVRDVTCSARLRNEPRIILRFEFDEDSILREGPIDRCWSQSLVLVDTLPVFQAHADEFRTVNWGEYAGSGTVGFDIRLGDATEDPLSSPEGVGAQADLLGAILAELPDDRAVAGSIDGISLGEMPVTLARSAVAAVADLTGRFPVRSASVGELTEVVLVSTNPAASAEAAAFLATTYPVFVVSVVSSAP